MNRDSSARFLEVQLEYLGDVAEDAAGALKQDVLAEVPEGGAAGALKQSLLRQGLSGRGLSGGAAGAIEQVLLYEVPGGAAGELEQCLGAV